MNVDWGRPVSAVDWRLLAGKQITRIGVIESRGRVNVMVDVEWEEIAPDGEKYKNKSAMNIYAFENQGEKYGRKKRTRHVDRSVSQN